MRKTVKYGVMVVMVLVILIMTLLEGFRRTPEGILDRRVAFIIMVAKLFHTPIHRNPLSINEIRRLDEKTGALLRIKSEVVREVYDTGFSHPGSESPISLRIYEPESTGFLPVIIYYHGGGWVLGSLDSHDSLCRKLCHRSGALVVAVDYRLAPEHPYPSAPDDCYAAYLWVKKNADRYRADRKRIALAGDSAGGNLAIVTALRLKKKSPLKAMALFYPATELRNLERDSYDRYSRGYLLEKNDVIWFRKKYAPDRKDWISPGISPLRSGRLATLPPLFLVTAEFDVLKDEGRQFSEKCRKAGVPVRYKNVPGMVHGFMNFGFMDLGDESINEAASFLKYYLNK